jgi:hypothetical protein
LFPYFKIDLSSKGLHFSKVGEKLLLSSSKSRSKKYRWSPGLT